MNRIIVLSLITLVFWGCNIAEEKQTTTEKVSKPYVVMLSLDAFRWDYPDMYNTPNLDSIANVGVKAKSIQSCFPSKTFPNHYSMATGLHPDNHGIVLNRFSDSILGEFKLSNRDAVSNPGFYGGEPIWVTAENQGVKSACYFWPGSEAPIKGVYPDVWKKYEEEVPFEDRLDSVISWLKKPSDIRPHLILWYMHEPDDVGHGFGPFADETKRTVEYLDSLVGVFCYKLNQLPIADSVNIIFTADHGMGEISADRTVKLSEHINKEWISDVKGGNPVYFIQPKAEFLDSVYNSLSVIPNMKCWKKNEIPERLVYGKNVRILDLVCVADSAWSIVWDKASYSVGGTHGYDPFNTDMHAIFYADGPAFKENYVHPTFTNINIYPLITEILSLKPAEIDGDLEGVRGMLK